MGQKQTIYVERKCDSCGNTVTLIQGQVTEDQLKASAGWIVLSKEHLIATDQLVPIAKLACTNQCAESLLFSGALELPKQQQQTN